MLPLYHSECSLCSTAWSQWFSKLGERLLAGCCWQSLDTWKTAARFGYVIIHERLLQGLDTSLYYIYVKDCCKVWIFERLLQGLNTRKTTASGFGYVKDCCKVWIRERPLQGLDTWKTVALGVEAWSTPSVGPRWMHTSAACCLNSLGYAWYWDTGSSNSLRSIIVYCCYCTCAFVGFQRSPTYTGCASSFYAQSRSLSGIQQQQPV